MATPQNRSNTKAGSGQETSKKNYTAQRYGTNDGELRFGQIDKQGRVTAGVQLNASEGTHTFSMDNDGERKGWTTSLIDLQEGDEAGIKSATIEFEGHLAFGHLKAESGVHRLVRISPFDSAAKRHTSFASIFITAVIDANIDIDINPADLRIDTYRASGAGGQHVNRTDSAVRITHTPSGIVVQSQTQRSQHQNKDTCMKLLKSKLYELEMLKRQEKQQAVEDQKSDIAFGSQIRSYVLHPYKMVKDHRTALESHSPDQVLDGSIDQFIKEFLVKSKK